RTNGRPAGSPGRPSATRLRTTVPGCGAGTAKTPRWGTSWPASVAWRVYVPSARNATSAAAAATPTAPSSRHDTGETSTMAPAFALRASSTSARNNLLTSAALASSVGGIVAAPALRRSRRFSSNRPETAAAPACADRSNSLPPQRNAARRSCEPMSEMPRNGKPVSVTRAEIASGVEAFLGRVVRETGVPGIAVSVRAGGEHLSIAAGHVRRGGPPLSPRHRFHAGCAIKLLLAVVALELAARGRLALDTAIGEPVAELRGTIHGATVRIAHLLSHTSGYRGTHLLDPAMRELDWTGLIALQRAAPQLFPPGTVFSYEHTESVLLGRILERATGREPLALVREMLLEPLGLAPGRL